MASVIWGQRVFLDRQAEFASDAVNYDAVIPFKNRLLETAWTNFKSGARKDLRPAYDEFRAQQNLSINPKAHSRVKRFLTKMRGPSRDFVKGDDEDWRLLATSSHGCDPGLCGCRPGRRMRGNLGRRSVSLGISGGIVPLTRKPLHPIPASLYDGPIEIRHTRWKTVSVFRIEDQRAHR